MRFLFFFTCVLVGFTACFNKVEIGNAKDVDPQSIFYDYKVMAEEGDNDATVKLQYRFGGPNGTTLVLDKPCNVTIDGVELQTDSARLTGAFYELVKPVDSFKGKHTIVFTDRDKKEHKEEFDFEPFTLAKELPEKIKRKPFNIALKGLPDSTVYLRLVMTDTSFHSEGVNEMINVEKGKLKVNEVMLSKLKEGPINIEIYREEERPVRNGSREGGNISITYGIKRQFELIK